MIWNEFVVKHFEGWLEEECQRVRRMPWVHLVEARLASDGTVLLLARVNKRDPRSWWYRLVNGVWW